MIEVNKYFVYNLPIHGVVSTHDLYPTGTICSRVGRNLLNNLLQDTEGSVLYVFFVYVTVSRMVSLYDSNHLSLPSRIFLVGPFLHFYFSQTSRRVILHTFLLVVQTSSPRCLVVTRIFVILFILGLRGTVRETESDCVCV